jgi:hypothetical protein
MVESVAAAIVKRAAAAADQAEVADAGRSWTAPADQGLIVIALAAYEPDNSTESAHPPGVPVTEQ